MRSKPSCRTPKPVSAKSSNFTPEGLVKETDYFRMMRIVRDGGYTGDVGVESGAGEQEGEANAIRLTRDLLLRIREEQKACAPIFNGQDLDGWETVEGGEWTVQDGVLVGRNGRDWSTNPEKTGSWLRTKKQYSDFRLELQYTISEKGNSGVFFRSADTKNPAFTGYEMQIYDAPGQAPSKGGPSAIYDVVAPTENRVRPAGSVEHRDNHGAGRPHHHRDETAQPSSIRNRRARPAGSSACKTMTSAPWLGSGTSACGSCRPSPMPFGPTVRRMFSI